MSDLDFGEEFDNMSGFDKGKDEGLDGGFDFDPEEPMKLDDGDFLGEKSNRKPSSGNFLKFDNPLQKEFDLKDLSSMEASKRDEKQPSKVLTPAPKPQAKPEPKPEAKPQPKPEPKPSTSSKVVASKSKTLVVPKPAIGNNPTEKEHAKPLPGSAKTSSPAKFDSAMQSQAKFVVTKKDLPVPAKPSETAKKEARLAEAPKAVVLPPQPAFAGDNFLDSNQ